MQRLGRKPLVALVLSAMVLLASGTGCRGFFVNSPESVTVSPNTPDMSTLGDTQPFAAIEAYSDNTTKTVTSSSQWSSSNPCVVAVIANGANAGSATTVGSGSSVTVTASYAGVTGTAT